MMKTNLLVSSALFLSSTLLSSFNVNAEQCPSLLQHQPRKLTSSDHHDLCQHSGEVVLVVNTASECGFTPQFEGLQALYQQYAEQGFTVLGFPSNDFYQEHKDAKKTADVCYSNYGVSFPMLAMGPVRGGDAQPIFKQLDEQSGISPKWNFYKYLIGRDGQVKAVFASTTKPDDKKLIDALQHELAQAKPL